MNILTHPVHTGYQFDLARTGHEFYSLDIPDTGEVFWDSKSRPQPANYHRLAFSEETPVKFDLALVHFEMGYHCLKRSNLPLIWKEHCLRRKFTVPAEWINRVANFSFASQTAAQRWMVPPEAADRKCIIGMGMDLQTYGGYIGDKGETLVVGQNIRSRGNEKGYDNLMYLAQKFRISVVGVGNEGIPGAIGPAANYGELVQHYQKHRIFLNPSNILGMSTLEAMATGMPVVSFRTINSDIIQNGINGLVVDSVAEAEGALNRVLKDRKFALELGRNARLTISEKFRMESFICRWNTLFQQAVEDHRSNCRHKTWVPFNIASKSPDERLLAESVTAHPFEYCRVGFDQRKIRLMPNGRVGLGAGGRELYWDVKIEKAGRFLEIYSGEALTCRLKQQPDGSWRGRWTEFEKMPILLTPILPMNSI